MSAIFELKVSDLLRARGWTNLRHNVRVGGVQIDLLGRSPSGVLTIVEVKMSVRYLYLTGRQRQRLFRAAASLATFGPVELNLATILGGELRLLPVDGLTA